MTPKVNQELRDQQARYQAERNDWPCLYGTCHHEHPEDPLPGGVEALRYGVNFKSLLLVRFTKRREGGWYVVRADNGRILGWMTKETFGEYKGQWAAHVARTAFLGRDVDDEGDMMDQVPLRLFFGKDQFHSAVLGHNDDRYHAAYGIVLHLAHEGATALGYGPHPQVHEYAAKPEQHIPYGEGKRRHCACDRPWPCPRRAALEKEAGQ